MAAKKKEIKEITPAAVRRARSPRRTRRFTSAKNQQTQFLGNGDAKAGAAQLAEKLHTEARAVDLTGIGRLDPASPARSRAARGFPEFSPSDDSLGLT